MMQRFFKPVGMALAALAALAGCSPIRALDALTPDDTYTLHADIDYGQAPRQQLDLYVPTTGQPPYPVVVFFYGGSWSSGSRQEYRFMGEALASRGMLAVVADYRLSPEVTYPVFIQDAARAVDWTARHIAQWGGDTRQLYVMGHSAGAYNAAMVALDPRWLGELGASPKLLAGWIGLAGPYDFLPITGRALKPIFLFPDTPPDSQPLAHAGPDAPRTFLRSGADDHAVDPRRSTLQLGETLRAAGVPVDVALYPNLGHAMLAGAFSRPLRSRAPVLDDVQRFVEAGGAQPAGATGAQR